MDSSNERETGTRFLSGGIESCHYRTSAERKCGMQEDQVLPVTGQPEPTHPPRAGPFQPVICTSGSCLLMSLSMLS